MISSVTSSGLKLSQTSEPSLRIVGKTTSHEFFETLAASSTQTPSNASKDLI